jgi:hypothetical protein
MSVTGLFHRVKRVLAAVLLASLALGGAGLTPALEAAPSAAASGAMGLALVGQYGGAMLSVAMQNGRAYVGRGPRLEIYNIANPAAPVLLGRSQVLPGVVEELAVAGDYAYLAARQGGLRVFDISDPAAPVEVAALTIQTAEEVNDIEIAGGRLYVSSFNWISIPSHGALTIYSLANPAAPQFLGTHQQIDAEAYGVAVAGDIAYLSLGWLGVRVLSVANPAQPVELTTVDTPVNARDVALLGNYAYVADQDRGLLVLDVSVPANASEVGSAAISTHPQDVAVLDGYAYVATDGGARAYDLSNPIAPTHVGSIFTAAPVRDVDAVGDWLFLAAAEGGMYVASLNNPAAPAHVGTTGLAENARGLGRIDTLFGSGVFLANARAGLGIVNVEDPTAPTAWGKLNTDGYAFDITLSSIYGYLSSGDAGLITVNLINPLAPTQTSQLDKPGSFILEAHVMGNRSYVSDNYNGLAITSLSTPATPAEIGTTTETFSPNSTVVSGTLAFVASSSPHPLMIVDVSQPDAPSIVGHYETEGLGTSIAVRDQHAYLTLGSYGLVVLNISDPTHPVAVGAYNTAGIAHKIILRGQRAYVADDRNGLLVFDLSQPAQPVLLAQHLTASAAQDVALDDEHIYVADSWGGLFIFRELNHTTYLPLALR